MTGGGTAGHVTPNLALVQKLKESGWDISYIGTSKGIEKSLVQDQEIPFYNIRAGKLRRYFDWKNFIDPFNVIIGIIQSFFHLRKIKPNVIFSKGGYVSVPVIIAGWLNGIPSIIHESDFTPGLANKISIPFCVNICTSFAEALNDISSAKKIHTGSPIRNELLEGNIEAGYRFSNFNNSKPVILILGGSLGSVKLNQIIRSSLPLLLDKYQIIHICGKGKIDTSYDEHLGYKQVEYLKEEMSDIYQITDIAVARSGSNSIFEFYYNKIPSLLIPLPLTVSRGDQILNAQYFKEKQFAELIEEDILTPNLLIKTLDKMYQNKKAYIDSMEKYKMPNGVNNIVNMLNNYRNGSDSNVG